MKNLNFDVIIIGAGAAGLMCAAQAKKRGRRILILDHAIKIGEKIRISGGGRSNFTNLYTSANNYLSENPRFCVSALKRYTQLDFIAMIKRYHIAYHERDHGQLFCDGSATQIIDMLLSEARGVRIQSETFINGIEQCDDGFSVSTNRGMMTSAAVVIATGGPSIPKMGATDFGYNIARQFGINVIEPRPGLVPLIFDLKTMEKLDGLAGISLNATVKWAKTRFDEALLFTHRGLSGPAILQISSYWKPGDRVTIDLLPNTDVFEYLKTAKTDHPKKEVRTALAQILPTRLAHRMVEWCGCDGRLTETSNKALRQLAEHINAWGVTPHGSEGYRTAEVTVGGIDTKELSSKTMESISHPGLYFIGEVVDVTGHLGGFNFQWAWSSGHACGQVV